MHHDLTANLPKAQPILVVGDLMLDEYVRGDVSRISPEAPVPVLEYSQSTQSLGGAGNVAANLADLGAQLRICGVVGRDEAGENLLQLLRAKQCDVQGVLVDAKRITTHKLRVVSQIQHMLRMDRERRNPLHPGTQKKAIAQMMQALTHVKGIVCADYQKGFCTPRLLRSLMLLAKAHNLPVIVDPRGRDYTVYQGASVLIPNRQELELATGLAIRTKQELDTAAWRLVQLLELDGLLVTCAKDGMVLFTQDGTRTHFTPHTDHRSDINRVGDTIIAVFSMAYFAGIGLQQAAHLANMAAGLVAQKPNSATLTRAELATACAMHQQKMGSKHLSWSVAQNAVEAARDRGACVVFAHGCFDLLHPGHVRFLQAAKAQGDCLVVGVYSDAAARAQKGQHRPLLDEQARVEMLSALSCVDYVVLFDQSTPEALIGALTPDVLVQAEPGPDTPDYDLAEAHGKRVTLLPRSSKVSTSKLVQKIVARYSAAGALSSMS